VKQRSRFYPRVRVDTSRSGAVGQAGGVLLTETIAAVGLDAALSAGWSRSGRGARMWVLNGCGC
jgi:hypothetical protein